MHNNHDMAKASLLTKETTNAVVDKVRAHNNNHGKVGELSYWKDHYHWTLAKTHWKTLYPLNEG